jgi:hypothetical protein
MRHSPREGEAEHGKRTHCHAKAKPSSSDTRIVEAILVSSTTSPPLFRSLSAHCAAPVAGGAR